MNKIVCFCRDAPSKSHVSCSHKPNTSHYLPHSLMWRRLWIEACQGLNQTHPITFLIVWCRGGCGLRPAKFPVVLLSWISLNHWVMHLRTHALFQLRDAKPPKTFDLQTRLRNIVILECWYCHSPPPRDDICN